MNENNANWWGKLGVSVGHRNSTHSATIGFSPSKRSRSPRERRKMTRRKVAAMWFVGPFRYYGVVQVGKTLDDLLRLRDRVDYVNRKQRRGEES